MATAGAGVPLCVDLDGTLILTDMLWESMFQLIREHPFTALAAPVWLLRGRANLKRQIAARAHVDVPTLPWNQPLIAWLRARKAEGRYLILCTAAEDSLARRVADQVGIFEEVLASDGTINLKGSNKARLLQDRFGRAFDYAGNSGSDRAIWAVGQGVILVETSPALTREMRLTGKVIWESNIPRNEAALWSRELRIRNWLWNVLFVAVAGPRPWITAAAGYVAICLTMSAGFIVNDLLDLPRDRVDPEKKTRPLATGEIGIPAATAAAIVLATAGLVLASTVSRGTVLLSALYLAGCTLYSLARQRVNARSYP